MSLHVWAADRPHPPLSTTRALPCAATPLRCPLMVWCDCVVSFSRPERRVYLLSYHPESACRHAAQLPWPRDTGCYRCG